MFYFEDRPVTMDEIRPLKGKGEAQRFIIWTNPHGTLGFLIITDDALFRGQCANEISKPFKSIADAFKWTIEKYNSNRERNSTNAK